MSDDDIYILAIVNIVLLVALRSFVLKDLQCFFASLILHLIFFAYFSITTSYFMTTLGILLPIVFIIHSLVALPAYFITQHIKENKNFSLKFLLLIVATASAYLYAALKVFNVIY